MTKFNKSTGVVTIMDENFEKSHPLMKDIVWKLNESTPMIHNTQAKHFTFRKIVEIKASKTKTLGEARGYVVADYQDFLEKQWVKELKRNFKSLSINLFYKYDKIKWAITLHYLVFCFIFSFKL